MNRPQLLCVATVVLSWIVAATHASIILTPKCHVTVQNRLWYNKNLRVHCKSGDNDMGFHEVRPGEVYGFTFRENFIGTTLFWCSLWQGPRYEHFQMFKAFYLSDDFARELCGSNTCKWIATEDGIFINNTWTGRAKLMYKWDVCSLGPNCRWKPGPPGGGRS